MHPFTSLTLWLWFSVTASVLPPPWLWGWSLLPLLALIVLPGARAGLKLVLAVMLPLGLGLYLVHGPWLRILLGGAAQLPASEAFPILPLWCRLFACLASAQLWLRTVSTERFVHALFASRLPIALAYLCCGPQLLKEQLGHQLRAIKEAQLARGVPFDGHPLARLRATLPLLSPLVGQALSELATRSMALDLRGFRSQPTRTRVVELPQRHYEPLLRYLLLWLALLEIVWRWWP